MNRREKNKRFIADKNKQIIINADEPIKFGVWLYHVTG